MSCKKTEFQNLAQEVEGQLEVLKRVIKYGKVRGNLRDFVNKMQKEKIRAQKLFNTCKSDAIKRFEELIAELTEKVNQHKWVLNFPPGNIAVSKKDHHHRKRYRGRNNLRRCVRQ